MAVQQIMTFLMFEGKAEEAISFYVSVFADSAIDSVVRYGQCEAGPAGTVHHALFTLCGQRFMCIDSPVAHGFGFTPAMSLYVAFDKEGELDRAYTELSEGGQILMPLDVYPFCRRYGWVNDRFGVSWQLALAEGAAGAA
ncbi:MAG: VOC family protein [Armatimonadetes bacterium]|nr:VOC family protein [Armatimonadota bacterium]